MPGQRYEKPQDLDVLRLFYESAYNENPKSEMATKWCLAHGLLPYDVAESLVKKETTKKETKPLKCAYNNIYITNSIHIYIFIYTQLKLKRYNVRDTI